MSARAELEAAFTEAEADLARTASMLAKAYAEPAATKTDLPQVFLNLAKANADVAQAEAELARARAACVSARAALTRLNLAEGMPRAYRSDPGCTARESANAQARTNRRKKNEDRRMLRATPTRAHTTRRKAGADRRKANEGLWLERNAPSDLNRTEPVDKSKGDFDGLAKRAVNDPLPGRDARPHTTQVGRNPAPAFEKSAAEQAGAEKRNRRAIGQLRSQKLSTREAFRRAELTRQAVSLLILALAYLQYFFIDVQLQIASLPSTTVLVWVPEERIDAFKHPDRLQNRDPKPPRFNRSQA